ncbi:MAG: tetratricopeptide repeat protein [Xenococcus sp. MO_188.B8]|nr:tetratricopeptide repeat protein [Xenococcus sp. MO_188.B8]
MRRWLICILLIGLFSLWGIDATVLAQTDKVQISQQQLEQGEAIAQKAFEAANQGDFAQAELYWTELIEEFPLNPAVWSNRGNVRVIQEKIDAAIADFDHAIAITDQYPDPYLNRGIAYELKQDWQHAIADYNQVLAINPQDPVAYNNRGNAQAGQHQWRAALADYQQASAISANFAVALANSALVTYQIGDHQEALRQLKNLVRKYPTFADVRAALTAILWVEGQQGEAESNWVAAVGLDPRYQNLEWVATIRRWPPEMVAALEKFLTLNEN